MKFVLIVCEHKYIINVYIKKYWAEWFQKSVPVPASPNEILIV